MLMIKSSQFGLLSLKFAMQLVLQHMWVCETDCPFILLCLPEPMVRTIIAFKLAHSLSIRLVNCSIAIERALTHSCNSACAKFATESTPIKSSQSCIISFRMPSFILRVAFRDMTDSIKLRMALLDWRPGGAEWCWCWESKWERSSSIDHKPSSLVVELSQLSAHCRWDNCPLYELPTESRAY